MTATADVLVIFGITGDLAKVMTFRSLYRLERRGLLHCPIVGVASSDWTVDRLREHAKACIAGTGEKVDDEVFARFAKRLSYVSGDFGDPATYERVRDAIGHASTPVFYLEIPPSFFGSVIGNLDQAGLTKNARVVVEKPFGHDLASARALNAEVHRHLDESQLLRIDHFLGKMGLDEVLFLRLPTRCSSRSGTGCTSRASRSRWPRTSASRPAAASTTPSGRCATSWSTTSCRSSGRRRWSRRLAVIRRR
jgi:glucose-6-phosphate 1-dehydrogenase